MWKNWPAESKPDREGVSFSSDSWYNKFKYPYQEKPGTQRKSLCFFEEEET